MQANSDSIQLRHLCLYENSIQVLNPLSTIDLECCPRDYAFGNGCEDGSVSSIILSSSQMAGVCQCEAVAGIKVCWKY